MTIRTRFAPSPTGYLHVGGARTALFSWLQARRHGGAFVLRIEDTDLERSSKEAVNAILEGMAWLGLDYEEGPFYQTDRFPRYNEVVDELLAKGHAYRCNCSRERLETLRAEQEKQGGTRGYDGHCRDRSIPADEPCVIRFRNPATGAVVFHDQVHGEVAVNNQELDDLIIRRTDGAPTYNLTVVVDDHDMAITHVIRGDDHKRNASRQINIFRALEWDVPTYAHVALIMGDDGAKLSKRHGAVSVMQYKEEGYLPEALLNYLVRLGWSHGDQEIFSIDEMIQLFDIEDVNRAASTFNTEKLQWLNQHYIKEGDPRHLAHLLSYHMGRLDIDPAIGPDLVEVVKAQQERAKTLVEMAEISAFFYRDYDDFDETAAKKNLRPVARVALEKMRSALELQEEWTPEALHQLVAEVSDALELKMGKVAQPLRVAVVGRAASPGIDVTLHLVGKAACLRRIDRALDYIRQREADG